MRKLLFKYTVVTLALSLCTLMLILKNTGKLPENLIQEIMFTSMFFKEPTAYTKVLSHLKYPTTYNEDHFKSENTKRRNKTQVIIASSLARSGTTFLSELLATLPNSVLFFEPLHKIRLEECLTNKTCHNDYLKPILTCNLETEFTNWLRNKKVFFQYFNAESYDCYKSNKTTAKNCISQINISSECSKSTVVLTKLIRTSLSYLSSLLKDEDLNLKIIYLVRDPRGSQTSINKFKDWEKNPSILCYNLINDLIIFDKLQQLYPSKVIKVYYEDLAYDTSTVVHSIFKFLFNINELPLATTQYILDHTNDNVTVRSPLGTYKNSRNEYQSWRLKIRPKFLRSIENEPDCRDSIKKMNLRLFGNLKNVRKLSLPLYVN